MFNLNDIVRKEVLLLLAIKPPGKKVELDHIIEKISRDTKASKNEIMSVLKELISEGLAKRLEDKYIITEEGRKEAWKLRYDENLNLSYRLVLLARYYYPKVVNAILPFLRDRPVSVVKIFSDELDPIHKVKPIFSRYAKMKPKKYHFINTERDLMRYVDMHAIDFIPYVHKAGQDYPDWLIIDIDAGDAIKDAGELGFNFIKRVTQEIYLTMKEDLDLIPYIKFSGSRGFQIWVSLEKPIGKFDDYRKAVIEIRDLVEDRLKNRMNELKDEFGELVRFPITTATVAKREERKYQILLDWSSLKKEGDVRAPFSMHYKTGLVSVPVAFDELMSFTPEKAKVEVVAKRVNDLIKYFEMKKSPTIKLEKIIGKGTLLAFFS